MQLSSDSAELCDAWRGGKKEETSSRKLQTLPALDTGGPFGSVCCTEQQTSHHLNGAVGKVAAVKRSIAVARSQVTTEAKPGRL